MDPITQQTALAAAGAGGGAGEYVDDLFSTYIYEGNGQTQSINNGLDLSGEGGLTIIKSRSPSADEPTWTDTERGAGYYVMSDGTSGQQYQSAYLSSFNSNGFSLGNGNQINRNANEYCSWSFRKCPGFFDVVTYTGNGQAGRQIAHSLGSKPGMIIVKITSSSGGWFVYHKTPGATKYLMLNQTGTEDSFTNYWNDTEPTATHFTVGSSGDVNGNSSSYVAYLFADDDQVFGDRGDESIIKVGSYIGNYSTAPEIDLGWEPQWVMIKSNGGSSSEYKNWAIFDNMRGVAHGAYEPILAWNRRTDEGGTYMYGAQTMMHFTQTGFKLESPASGWTVVNEENTEHLYVAIRRPHKKPTVGTDVFAVDSYGPTSSSSYYMTYTSGFPVDMAISKFDLASTRNFETSVRTLQDQFLETNDSGQKQSDTAFKFDYNTGWRFNSGTSSSSYSWMFRRAPTYFDVVHYDGVGGGNVSHALGVKPELILTKRLDGGGAWAVYADALGAQYRLRLNFSGGKSAITSYWNDTEPTSSVFTVGNDTNTGGNSYKYVAYLFASCPGISKIGTYTGDGGNNNHVYLGSGYTTQPRFVLIKAADATGDWVLTDSLRGNASGYDPYVRLNESTAEVTGTNVIHAGPAGGSNSAYFTPFDILNTSGVTYLYLAIL